MKMVTDNFMQAPVTRLQRLSMVTPDGSPPSLEPFEDCKRSLDDFNSKYILRERGGRSECTRLLGTHLLPQ